MNLWWFCFRSSSFKFTADWEIHCSHKQPTLQMLLCRTIERNSLSIVSSNMLRLLPKKNIIEKPPVAQLRKNFPTYYVTWRFITVLTRARRWSLFWVRGIQSIPQPIFLRFIPILSSHVCLCLPSGLFISGFPTKTTYIFVTSHACYMPCPCHLYWLYR
jgi:hypothetical protein